MALLAPLNPDTGITERTPHGYRWIITPEERSNMASLLGCEENVSDIYMKAVHMDNDRAVCATCSKPAGMDDLVQNALMLNVHSSKFMLDILQNGTDNKSPGHELMCSKCGTKHEGVQGWHAYPPWIEG
ncbi:hypothetical protein CNMCM7691_008285 [Aspergillus felis]|uniref:RBP protein n=1 Tax=Aspergillus felis TaxID=1287682 RepID=A0A8H6V6A4_9EURO|nr:hypothetical protein CNMCM7691_008285 [Aspergillus felis]